MIVAVGLDPLADARELGAPDEADGPLRPGQAAVRDQGVEDAGDLEDAGAAGDVVVGALLLHAFEEVGREDDLAGGRVGPGDMADDVLEIGLLRLRLDLGPGRDLLVGQEPALEDVALADRKLEGEARRRGGRGRLAGRDPGLGGLAGRRSGRRPGLSGRGPAGPAALRDAGPGHLQRVEIGPGHADRNDPEGALLHGRAVGHHQRAFGDDDLALDLGLADLFRRAAADPDELARDVGGRAAGRQHGQHVVDRGQLLTAGLGLPEIALDGHPGRAAGEGRRCRRPARP